MAVMNAGGGSAGKGSAKAKKVQALALVASAAFLHAVPALADRISNPVAVFNGLDKITGRIVNFEVAIAETVQFGSLQLTPRICYTRPPTEAPNTTAFIEVDETSANQQAARIFTGWVFASSPGLHGIEHPVYDIWLVDCKGGKTDEAPASPAGDSATEQGAIVDMPLPPPRPRDLPETSEMPPREFPPEFPPEAPVEEPLLNPNPPNDPFRAPIGPPPGGIY